MKIAISQSNYLPWQGYFDLIDKVDTFVFLDDVQYTERDWRNRNRIKGVNTQDWLTIPVFRPKGRESLINQVLVSDSAWSDLHKRKILHTYRRAINYASTSEWLFEKYDQISQEKNLSRINIFLIKEIANKLGIDTKFASSDLTLKSKDKTIRLLNICELLGATTYLSGPAAKNYLDTTIFEKKGIEVKWMEYSPVEYKQLSDPFDPQVSILDLLFNSNLNFRTTKQKFN